MIPFFSFVTKLFASSEDALATEKEKEEQGEESPTITLPPPLSFKYNGDWFDKEDTFSDLDFIIAGLEKPLKLHKTILLQTSKFVKGILKAKQASKSASCNEIRWMFDTSKEADREALVKVLRFCYGDTITVGVDNGECCAVIAALFRLQVICAVDTVAKLSNFAKEQAETNLRAGVELLMATQQYPECSNTNLCALDKQLAKHVLSKKRIQEHHDTVVDQCLMKLPVVFLDIARYSKAHTKWSEFTVRTRYVRFNSGSLNQKEKEAIMKKCDWNTLMSRELNQLVQLGFVEQDTIIAMYHSVLERTEREQRYWHIRAIKAEKERDAQRERARKEESRRCELKEETEREKDKQKDRTIERLEKTIRELRATIRLL